jgi:hypothetical protein
MDHTTASLGVTRGLGSFTCDTYCREVLSRPVFEMVHFGPFLKANSRVVVDSQTTFSKKTPL